MRQVDQNITSQMCSVGFRSGECGGQSMVSVLLSSGNCLHNLTTRERSLSCIRRNPGHTALAGTGSESKDIILMPRDSQGAIA